jgi:hypothetical protein
MSHDTGHGQSNENKSIISFKNSFWLVVIIVGLFIAALNFIKAESGNEEEGKGEAKEKTEMNAASAGEKSEQKAESAPAESPAKDTAQKSAK